jgi:hypothetical protein
LVPLRRITALPLFRFVPAFALHQIDQAGLTRGQLPHDSSEGSGSCRSRTVVLLTEWHRWDIDRVTEKLMIFSVFVLKFLSAVSTTGASP